MEGTMVSQDFRKQLEGYGLTTANILYRHSLPAAGSPLASADLCLAGLRPVPALSRAQQIPALLVGNARRAAALGDRRPFAPDPAGGDSLGRRRVPFALSAAPTLTGSITAAPER